MRITNIQVCLAEVTSIMKDKDDPAVIPEMKQVSFIRTARVLMDGITYVRESVL